MVRFRRHHNNNGRRTVRSGRTAKQVEAIEKKILKRGGDMQQDKKSTTIPPDIMAMQRKRVAANSPGTEKILADMPRIEEYIKDLRKRRSGKLWLIAEKIKNVFLKEGITTRPIKEKITDETASIELAFRQGEYVDATKKRREHRWKITIENIDCLPEGICPNLECDGEMETEILDDGNRRVACGECGYEHSSFCGVEAER